MHIPRISRPHIGGALRKIKHVCADKVKAAKRTLPGMLMMAQSFAIPAHAPGIEKFIKTTTSAAEDVFEHHSPDFTIVKGMIQRVVPDISDEFVAQVVETAEQVKCSPQDLTALLYKESRFKPDARNGNFGGLGQMNKKSLNLSISHADKDEKARYGITPIAIEKFLSLPREQQMPYVRNYILAMKNVYIKNPNKKLSGGELYGLFYTPGRINKKFLSSANDPATAKFYQQNKGLDFNKDTKITKQDLQQVLNHVKMTDLNINIAKK